MSRLNQIIAVEKTIKSETEGGLTKAHHALQKTDLLGGISRTYTSLTEDGEQLPSESKLVQVKAQDMITETAKLMTRLFDVTATKEWGNTQARADIVVGGQVLLKAVPATYLLFLEKQLVNIRTFVAKLPTLDPAETWHYDTARDMWATETSKSFRTKKVLRNHVKSEATEKFPAQVETYAEDINVGTWVWSKSSGALEVKRVRELLSRVEALQEAVKFAREEANTTLVEDQKVGDKIFTYLFK